jgi:hypothetical protein
MIVSSVVDLRVRGGIVPAHAGRLDKVAGWVDTILARHGGANDEASVLSGLGGRILGRGT